jgi:uncharacterized RDD family membrane protein YckC
MADYGSKNLYAPPRAEVNDPVQPELEMVNASRGARFAAAIVDGLPMLVVGIVFVASMGWSAFASYRNGDPSALFENMSWTPVVVAALAMVAVYVYSAVLVYRLGQTIGKSMLGIRVVRMDGSRVTFARFVFVRFLPLVILGLIPVVGRFLTNLVDPLLIFRGSSRCLHDNIADTKVVTAESSPYATLNGSSGDHLRTISF